jgi:hypothetical protein
MKASNPGSGGLRPAATASGVVAEGAGAPGAPDRLDRTGPVGQDPGDHGGIGEDRENPHRTRQRGQASGSTSKIRRSSSAQR